MGQRSELRRLPLLFDNANIPHISRATSYAPTKRHFGQPFHWYHYCCSFIGTVSMVGSERPIWITEKTSDQAQDGSDHSLVDLFESLDAQYAATGQC